MPPATAAATDDEGVRVGEGAGATGGHAATPAPARATGKTATGKRPRRQGGNAGGAAVGCDAPPPLDNKAVVVAACGHAEAATAFSASAAAAAATPRVPPVAAADVACTTGVAATGRWPRRQAGGSGGAAVGRAVPHTPYATAGVAVIGGRAEVASAAVWFAAAAAAAVTMPTAAAASTFEGAYIGERRPSVSGGVVRWWRMHGGRPAAHTPCWRLGGLTRPPASVRRWADPWSVPIRLWW